MTQGEKRIRGNKASQASGRSPDNTSWDHVADWYDTIAAQPGTEFHQNIVIPGTLRMLGLHFGEKVLDLACGQGTVTRALHRAGAQATGVDLSPRLIGMARQHSSRDIRYVVGDACCLDSLPDQSFDAIVCVLAAQNIDPIESVFQESARLLHPMGRLVLVLNHPSFRIPRQTRWQRDEDRKLLCRVVDRYLTALKIPIDTHPFKSPGRKTTWTFHRPLQTYVNGLSEAGLWTNALEEWPSHKSSQPGPAAHAENRARAEFPLFLALRAVRVEPHSPAP